MILFYMLISVMPLTRHPIWSDVVGDLTVVKYLGAGTAAYAACFLLTRTEQPRLLATAQSRWFALFAVWATISYLTQGSRGPFELSPMMSYLSFVLLFFTTLVMISTVERLRSAVLVAVGSVGFASLHVLREWQKYGQFSAEYRPGWVTGDPNYYSVSALLCLPLAYHLGRHARPMWVRWFCWSCLALTLLGLTASASRGGLIGLLAVALVEVIRSRRRTRLALALAIVLCPLMMVAPASPVKRLLNPTPGDRNSADSRVALWTAGLRMVGANPLVGVGLGRFKESASRYGADLDEEAINHVAHNTHLEVAAEMGVPALVLFWGLLVSTFRSLGRVMRTSTTGILCDIAEGTQVGLTGALVAAVFVSAEYQKLLWLLIFISMCLPRLVIHCAAANRNAVRSSAPYPSGGSSLEWSGATP